MQIPRPVFSSLTLSCLSSMINMIHDLNACAPAATSQLWGDSESVLSVCDEPSLLVAPPRHLLALPMLAMLRARSTLPKRPLRVKANGEEGHDGLTRAELRLKRSSARDSPSWLSSPFALTLNGRFGSVERARSIASIGKARRCRGGATQSEGSSQTERSDSESPHN